MVCFDDWIKIAEVTDDPVAGFIEETWTVRDLPAKIICLDELLDFIWTRSACDEALYS
jgi:hypothetical protein